jgi:hypothetical protein
MHPTDIPAFQSAIGALDTDSAPEAAQDALLVAQTAGSVVTQCGGVLDALSPHVATLSLAEARVLAGAAHLVLTNGWLGRAGEADGVRDAARARIAALE